jgi:nicotinamidase/pyrazinamidase
MSREMRTVFVDVDTQIDFMYPAGSLYVPGAETIVNRIAKLNRFAAEHEIPVISTVDAHSEDDPEFRQWPHHCVVGTTGQHKCAATLLEKRIVVPNAPGFSISPALTGVKQIIVEKQTIDVFSNMNLAAILQELHAERFAVYGVVTEICVKSAALGLRKTGARVEVVTDAIRSLSDEAAANALAEFANAGCALTSIACVAT